MENKIPSKIECLEVLDWHLRNIINMIENEKLTARIEAKSNNWPDAFKDFESVKVKTFLYEFEIYSKIRAYVALGPDD